MKASQKSRLYYRYLHSTDGQSVWSFTNFHFSVLIHTTSLSLFHKLWSLCERDALDRKTDDRRDIRCCTLYASTVVRSFLLLASFRSSWYWNKICLSILNFLVFLVIFYELPSNFKISTNLNILLFEPSYKTCFVF